MRDVTKALKAFAVIVAGVAALAASEALAAGLGPAGWFQPVFVSGEG